MMMLQLHPLLALALLIGGSSSSSSSSSISVVRVGASFSSSSSSIGVVGDGGRKPSSSLSLSSLVLNQKSKRKTTAFVKTRLLSLLSLSTTTTTTYNNINTNHNNQEEDKEKHVTGLLHGIPRGGAGTATKAAVPASSTTTTSVSKEKWMYKNGKRAIVSFGILYGIWYYRKPLFSVFNKQKLQDYTLNTLQKLNDLPYLYSRLVYTIGMIVWECLGMSTIPVETAAGMVFGWSACIWSGIGKLVGACLAFGLGRGILQEKVQNKLSSNTFLQLVQNSANENPFRVLILMKLSCFPETIKNFGSSILQSIRWWMFVLGTAVHGWTFTLLWTYLGVDSAKRIAVASLPPDRRLQSLLSLALINGCIVSPLSMAYWIRTLTNNSNSNNNKNNNK